MMGLKGMGEKVELYRQKMSQLLSITEKEEEEEQFFYWCKSNCQDKYFVEFSIQQYKMGKITFEVLKLKESIKI